MSQENVEIVTGVFEAVNERDFEAVIAAYAEDMALAIHTDVGVAAITESGKRAVVGWFADWFMQFEEGYRFEIEQARDAGDRVFLVVTHYGRGRSSGAPVTQRLAYVYTLRDRKISRCEVWGDEGPALEAAGLSE